MKTNLSSGKILYFPSDDRLNKSGVYRVTFEDGTFYFGSSGNFLARLRMLRSQFNTLKRIQNKKLLSAMSNCAYATFEIIEIITSKEEYKCKETELIKQYYSNPLLINRSFSDTNLGIKWTQQEKDKIRDGMIKLISSGGRKKRVPFNEWKLTEKWKNKKHHAGKQIIMFDLKGVEISRFPSRKEAARYIGVSRGSINTQMGGFNKFKKHIKGYMFMDADEYDKKI